MIKMVWNWIFKRLFTPKRVASLIKNNTPIIAEAMKDSIQSVLEDEAIAGMVIQYTDEVYNRYLGKSGKLWSTIGGVQKGINYAIEGEAEKLNPFSGLINAEGEISLAGLVKGFLAQSFKGNSPQQRQGSPRGGGTPNMQPI